MSAPMIVLFVLASVLAVGLPVALGILIFRLITKNHAGGWSCLAERFPAPAAILPPFRRGASMQVDLVSHKRCLALSATPEGLWIRDSFPGLGGLFPPLLIPWSEFRARENTWYFGSRAYRLAVGSPPIASITLTRALFDEIHRAREAVRPSPTSASSSVHEDVPAGA